MAMWHQLQLVKTWRKFAESILVLSHADVSKSLYNGDWTISWTPWVSRQYHL
ncbi:hypothetical protein GCK32_003494 [Trichostrongylus colubriformis]|uniref:Uncharacterized protein n=1 Tax=Trichostrongylus colubriformis TaxID=6319 RepID=A0AAN8FRY4_TRICO